MKEIFEERGVLLDDNIELYIHNIIKQVKCSNKSKIIINGNSIIFPLTWATLNYQIIIHIGVYDDSYTNLDNYKPYESDIIPGKILADNFIINIFIPGKNSYSMNLLKEDLHHELLHVYQFNKKVNYNFLKNNKVVVKFDEIKLFDTKAYNYILKLKNNLYDSDIADFASLLYFIMPDEFPALLNSYYEELMNNNNCTITPIDFKETNFYLYLKKFHKILIKLEKDTKYFLKIEKYFKNILCKYYFNINVNLSDDDFKKLLIRKLNLIFTKTNKKADKVLSLVTDTFDKINKEQIKNIPHYR